MQETANETALAKLREFLPELSSADLPQEALDAEASGEDPVAALLRFALTRARETAAGEQANEATTGSLYEPVIKEAPEQAAFFRAFRSALKH